MARQDSRRRPFIARARHPQWGAEMAAAGSRPAVIDLIRRHQDKHDSVDNENDRLLAQPNGLMIESKTRGNQMKAQTVSIVGMGRVGSIDSSRVESPGAWS